MTDKYQQLCEQLKRREIDFKTFEKECKRTAVELRE
jgi:L-rhamnose isomerase